MGDIVDVGHRLHIDPTLGGRHDQVGASEPKGRQQHDALLDPLPEFPQQILSGHPEMDIPGAQRGGDIRGGGEANPNVVEPLQGGRVSPSAAYASKGEAAVLQPRVHLLLQATLGRYGDDELIGHRTASFQARPGLTMHPTAPVGSIAPSLAGRLS